MDEIIHQYRKLIALLEEEEETISRSLKGDLLELYRDVLRDERERLEKYLSTLIYHS